MKYLKPAPIGHPKATVIKGQPVIFDQDQLRDLIADLGEASRLLRIVKSSTLYGPQTHRLERCSELLRLD
jgi:hypothetical protein